MNQARRQGTTLHKLSCNAENSRKLVECQRRIQRRSRRRSCSVMHDDGLMEEIHVTGLVIGHTSVKYGPVLLRGRCIA